MAEGMANGMAKLRAADDTLAAAVAATIDQLNLDDVDKAAVALAKRYARELDDAALIAASLARALEEVSAVDRDLYFKLLPLATRIEEAHIAATIGPKLLSVLDALGATPAARSKIRKEVTPRDGPNRLSQLREARGG